MHIDVITVFPKILHDPLDESILKQARKRVDLEINLIDLREYTEDRHRTVDDTPYGGGPGMILKPAPLFRVLEERLGEPGGSDKRRVVFPTPQGRQFSQHIAADLSRAEHLVFICGHYKAVDQRVIDTWVTDEISVGDFVLSGGEIPALLMIDAVVRLIPGVLGDIESALSDSFQNGLLDCPYYTRPEDFRGMAVPEVLLSGNHARIEEWRQKQRENRTRQRRPDLYTEYVERKKTEHKEKK